MMICKHGRRNRRGILSCDIDGMVCLHIKYCQITMKWSQTEEARECLKREYHDGAKEDNPTR